MEANLEDGNPISQLWRQGPWAGQRAWVLGTCAEFVPFWAVHFHFPSLREPRLPVRSTGPGIPELLLHQ